MVTDPYEERWATGGAVSAAAVAVAVAVGRTRRRAGGAAAGGAVGAGRIPGGCPRRQRGRPPRGGSRRPRPRGGRAGVAGELVSAVPPRNRRASANQPPSSSTAACDTQWRRGRDAAPDPCLAPPTDGHARGASLLPVALRALVAGRRRLTAPLFVASRRRVPPPVSPPCAVAARVRHERSVFVAKHFFAFWTGPWMPLRTGDGSNHGCF